MSEKFQVVSMQYGELQIEQTYHREIPWRV